MNDISRKLIAEGLGTLILVATVVGSGIMADRLSDDVAVSLLGNTIPTGAILFVLISGFGPISGAHFNPAVSLAFFLRGDLEKRNLGLYVFAQIFGAILGTWLAHAMFEHPLLEFSQNTRAGSAQFLSEVVATFGLVWIIFAGVAMKLNSIPALVGLYITAAYWFTASTSFANPAVAIGRAFTDTFSGIRPVDVPLFILAQILGAIIATYFCRWLYKEFTS